VPAAAPLLAVHLGAAARLEDRLTSFKAQAACAQAALDQLDDGVLLLDARARQVFANRTGSSLLAEEPALSAALEALAARGRRELREGGILKVNRAPRPPLQLRVAPLGQAGEAAWSSAQAVAIAFVSDPTAAHRRRAEALARAYDLTPGETRVAMEIATGDGRIAVARRLGISPATAQAHLARIFEKTGTHRQAELVRLLLDTLPG